MNAADDRKANLIEKFQKDLAWYRKILDQDGWIVVEQTIRLQQPRDVAVKMLLILEKESVSKYVSS